MRVPKYSIVLIDKISCQSYVDWTYENNDETPGRKGLNDIQLCSAIEVANNRTPILQITSVTKDLFENECDQNRGLVIGSLLESVKEIPVPQTIYSEEVSILKTASILKFVKVPFAILTGNILLFDKAVKEGFDVFLLKNSDSLFKEENPNE